MRQSNAYIIIFSAVLTIILGGMLSVTSVGLKPLQDQQVELDTKKKILGAVMDISNIKSNQEILALYEQRVKSIVVDINGNLVEKDDKGNPIIAERINIQKNHKRGKDVRYYPVFMFTQSGDQSAVDAYVFPMFGAGLWDWISGFVAIDKDLNTIRGVAFDHKSETPGLGARISSAEIQSRYVGKKIFSADNSLVSVVMVKGEGKTGLTDHQVDGMSGATLTGKGVNEMMANYLGCYINYINKNKSGTEPVAAL